MEHAVSKSKKRKSTKHRGGAIGRPAAAAAAAYPRDGQYTLSVTAARAMSEGHARSCRDSADLAM